MLGRLIGAGVVGVLPAVLGAPALFALLFGAWWVALPLFAVIVVSSVSGLSLLYRHSGGTGSARRWATRVTAGAITLAGGCAIAWQQSGGAFGRNAVLWQAAIAAAFVICAGVGTRATRVPAAALLVTVSVAATTQFGPTLAGVFEPRPPRGCIATTAEEAAARCP